MRSTNHSMAAVSLSDLHPTKPHLTGPRASSACIIKIIYCMWLLHFGCCWLQLNVNSEEFMSQSLIVLCRRFVNVCQVFGFLDFVCFHIYYWLCTSRHVEMSIGPVLCGQPQPVPALGCALVQHGPSCHNVVWWPVTFPKFYPSYVILWNYNVF
jgi:hypothetical protein